MEIASSSSPDKSDNISIDNQLQRNNELTTYKDYVRHTVQEIAATLRRLEGSCPEIHEELLHSLTKCNELLEVPLEPENHSFMNLSESGGRNQHASEKFMPLLDPVLFPSQCNF